MDIRIFKLFFAVLVLSMLQSCPSIGEEVCDDIEVSAYVDDLITITPLKTVYNLGEEITYKLTIAAENNYFGNNINLYQKTGDANAWYTASSLYLFEGNQVTYIKGSARQGANNWHNVSYNSTNGNYELEIKVKLDKLGDYSIYCRDIIEFIGADKCNRNRITTTIQGKNVDNFLKFKVQ